MLYLMVLLLRRLLLGYLFNKCLLGLWDIQAVLLYGSRYHFGIKTGFLSLSFPNGKEGIK